MAVCVFAFFVSALLTLLIVRSQHRHGFLSGDHDLLGPQKIHTQVVPRIGGIAIFISMLATVLLLPRLVPALRTPLPLELIACALPAFVAGIVQDFTDTLSPGQRLVAAACSALLAYLVLDAAIVQTDIPGLDWVASFTAGSVALTVLAVSGMANAINIIDGLNGLAAMCGTLMLAAIGYVGFQVSDPVIAALALAGIGAVLGFFLWNYPAGLIFLGDGGAYFIGFLIAELSILLLHRNPDEVSPLFPLLVCMYPITETLFSIYRRRFLRALPPSMPDGIHLHSLIYRRIMRWAAGGRGSRTLTRRNSATSPLLWLLCCGSVVPAMLFWDNSGLLALCLAAFVVYYVALYWRIVRFKSPRWIKMAASRSRFSAGRDNRRR